VYVHVCVRKNVQMCTRVYMCVGVYMCVCMRASVHVHMCVHATDTMPPLQSTDPEQVHTEAHLEHAVEQAGMEARGCDDVPD